MPTLARDPADPERDHGREPLPDGWQQQDPLAASPAHLRHVAATGATPGPAASATGPDDAARERHTRDIAATLHAAATRPAAPNSDARSTARETAHSADQLDRLVLLTEQLYVELQATRRGWFDHAEIAAADIVQNAATVLAEIALLLRHGYASGAEARWRGLHELAATAALLAADPDPPIAAERYLAHGERLLDDDPAYDQPWAADPRYFDQTYEWLRATHPHLDKHGKPRPFTQAWLFKTAQLAAAPFSDWLRPSHGPVHMNSRAVAAGAEQAGAAPAGYTREATDQVAWQAACSLYELVAHALLLPDEQAFDPARALAWTDTAADHAAALRPAPTEDPYESPRDRAARRTTPDA